MKEQILSKGNKIFSVTFIKKDGSTRRMVARLGVRKGVKGVGMSFSPSEKNLMVVFDMHKRAFRMINLETIVELK
jgi:hypothetical protein